MLKTVNRTRLTNTTLKISMVAVFSALSLGTNYAMSSLPNIKIMDALVFVAAFLFGLRVGIGVAVVTWLVYGFVNLYGQAGYLLFFLMIGESFYAIAGALFRRTKLSKELIGLESSSHRNSLTAFQAPENGVRWSFVLLGIIGLLAALAYDVFTNTATWLLQLYDPSKNIGTLLSQAFFVGLITMNFPLPMGLMHQVSDLFFFATVAPLVVKAVTSWSSLGERL